jgi:CelD/BcsL family acetyltransferase involved in cellulose biosynthesis
VIGAGLHAAPPAVRATAIDPIADPAWTRLLERSPGAGPFHHPHWLALLSEQYGYAMEAVCAEDEEGELVAGLPVAHVSSRLTGRRLVALPFTDLCPPVVAAGASMAAHMTLGAALDRSRRRYGLALEVRAPYLDVPGGWRGRSFLHHTLALERDIGAVEARATPQIARGIRKAQREGVEIEFGTDRDALDRFYRLHLHTRRRLGVPTQPKRFIRGLAGLLDAGLGWVALARRGEATVAGAVFLSFGGTVVYKYGASDARHLRARPNNLLFAAAIRRACAEGAHTLDLGRTDLDNPGLARFKRAWGAEERTVSYVVLGDDHGDGARVSGVPAPMGTVIRRGPPVVGRLIGAAFYRHAG